MYRLSTMPLHRRLMLSQSNRPVVLALAIPGANPFSGILLPPLCALETRVQKNNMHPYQRSGLFDAPIRKEMVKGEIVDQYNHNSHRLSEKLRRMY